MRLIKEALLFIFMLFCLVGCNNRHAIELGDFYIDNERLEISERYNAGNKFTLSFWVNIKSNYVGSEIISINYNGEKVTLLNNTEDEDGNLTGLVLAHDNGLLYKDNSDYLRLNTYNHIAIEFDKKYFRLYLNGNLVNEKAFSKSFKGNNLALTIGSDNLKADITNLVLYNYIDTNVLIANVYKNDEQFKIDLNFNECFLDNASGKIKLPRTDEVEYKVSNGALIDNGFLIFEENSTDKDRLVTLTATYSGLNKEYIFKVRGNNKDKLLLDAYNKVFNNLEYVISESDIFPKTVDGFDVSYKVIDGKADYIDEHFVKDKDATEKEKCTIAVTIGDKSFKKEVTLLDEYNSYLLSGFTGSAFYPDVEKGDEKMCFLISDNLIDFKKVEIDVVVNEGTKRLRDAFLNRDKDGNYVLMATQGFMNKEIYIGTSNELTSINTKLCDISYYDKDLDIPGNYTWAPEFVYDCYNDLYVLIYSDPEKETSAIYAVTTKDFKSFSYPYVFFDAGYKIIDADIELIDGKYYLFYKDESDAGYGNIYYAVTDNLAYNSTWRIYDSEDDLISIGESLEGPFALRGINNKYYFYADAHESNKIYYGEINQNDEKINISLDKLISNEVDGIHHFSIIKLTNKEYERIGKS